MQLARARQALADVPERIAGVGAVTMMRGQVWCRRRLDTSVARSQAYLATNTSQVMTSSSRPLLTGARRAR